MRVIALLVVLTVVAEARQLRKTEVLPKHKYVVALDRNLKTKMLVQTDVAAVHKTAGVVDPCDGISCGATCPAGFTMTPYPGHCCPYCVNPAIKVEDAVKGATGKFGGEQSTFCPNVWCFPTLCTEANQNPTLDNQGEDQQCCPECPGRAIGERAPPPAL